MKIIDLDAANWREPVDLFDAVCVAVGAPDWHTRGIDALLDTMIWHDDINAVTPPYLIRIHHLAGVPKAVHDAAQELRSALVKSRTQHQKMYGRDVPAELKILN